MVDKEKIREWLEKKMYAFNLSADIASSEDYNLEKIEDAKYQLCKEILQLIDSLPEEPVSEDLMNATNNYCVNVRKGYPRVKDEIDRYICNAFEAGANWQKQHLWKNAQGDDLPEIDREVVAFQTITHDELKEMEGALRVVIAHRPNPKGWDGKSLSTGKVEHYTPRTYEKGGWNIPNVKYWLDAPLPEGIE